MPRLWAKVGVAVGVFCGMMLSVRSTPTIKTQKNKINVCGYDPETRKLQICG